MNPFSVWSGEPLQVQRTAYTWPYANKQKSTPTRGLIFDTSQGYVGIALDAANRLTEVAMPRDTPEEAADALGIGSLLPVTGGDPAQPLIDQIRQYLSGEAVQFDWPLNLDALTPFQQEALHICASIPYGEMRSYGWIADRMGRPKSARPVGGAMGANPIPILIPCHRVVGSNGKMVGYGGGMDWKIRLLRLEGLSDLKE